MENADSQNGLHIILALSALLGFGAIFRNYVVEIAKGVLPKSKRLVRWLNTRGILPNPEPTHFTILIADLDGDDDDLQQTRYVDAALRDYAGLEIIRVGPGPKRFDKGSRRQADTQTQAHAQKELSYHNGDIYIFGEVAKADARLRMKLLGTQLDTNPMHGSYGLEDAELPMDFTADFHALLLVQILEAVSPVIKQEGRFVADLLHLTLQKLQHLADHMPSGLDTDQRGLIQHSLGLVAYRIGEQSGKHDLLETAVSAYRAALQERTQARVPLDWARTQNNLGSALTALGDRESGIARLEEAANAYRAALEKRIRARVPLDWARTQNNLGNALRIIGERERSITRLQEAIAAFRSALEERARENVPHDWATTQMNLGIAFQLIGTLKRDTVMLEDAVVAFETAMEGFPQKRVPLRWAATQNNLGNALSILGKCKDETAILERAVTAFQSALEERAVEQVPLDWATTQNNLGTALIALGEKENSVGRLEEAVVALGSALRERTRERVPLLWAMTQENLGLAYRLIAERSWDPNIARRAIRSIEEAQTAFEDENATYNIGKAKLNLAVAEGLLAAIEGEDIIASNG